MEYTIFVQDQNSMISENMIVNSQTKIGLNLNRMKVVGETHYDTSNHISYNLLKEELLESEELLNFVGVFLSDYSDKNKFSFKVRVDGDYNLEKTMVFYKYNF